MTEELLKDIVKEVGIVEIIIEYKKDMDFQDIIEKRKQWIKKKQELEKKLDFASRHISKLNKYLKKILMQLPD